MPRRSPAPNPRPTARDPLGKARTILVLPDQMNLALGPLVHARKRGHRIMLVESRPWLSRRPYHRQRIATILLARRCFTDELLFRGIASHTVISEWPLGEMVRLEAASCERPIVVMEPAEREMRAELAPLVRDGLVEVVPHDGWLTTHDEFRRACPRAPFRMDAFYRQIRRTHDLLMDEGGQPLGGRLSFDADNRQTWRGEPPAPEPPRFRMTPLRQEVAELIDAQYGDHPGTLDIEAIPGSLDDVETLWKWAKRSCLPNFGPYEDAMSVRSRGLFHTRISAMINLYRLLPRRVLDDVLAMDLPLPSKEGFVRQLIGWREFVRHVHLATDGFRRLGDASTPLDERADSSDDDVSSKVGERGVENGAGDGGYARWSGLPWSPLSDSPWKGRDRVDPGAAPNALEADLPLPPAWWGTRSGLACLDNVVADVWQEGWSHHITRLMVLGNIATLIGASPRELTDWFWAAYVDSWDWVVEPNVLGMATFAAGEVMTTKPYVSGANYIDRMSDHCRECAFDPKRTCPLTRLYWAFLARHATRFAKHPRMAARMGVVLKAVAKRPDAERQRDARIFVHVRELLVNGRTIAPADLADAAGRFD